jgi:hypothetical protein
MNEQIKNVSLYGNEEQIVLDAMRNYRKIFVQALSSEKNETLADKFEQIISDIDNIANERFGWQFGELDLSKNQKSKAGEL